MERLSEESMAQAIEKCKEQSRYRVLIVVRYMEYVHTLLKDLDNEYDKRISKSRSHIRYPNGSCIDIISSSSNARGYKAHLVLYDDRICDCETMLWMRAMERATMDFDNPKLMED